MITKFEALCFTSNINYRWTEKKYTKIYMAFTYKKSAMFWGYSVGLIKAKIGQNRPK